MQELQIGGTDHGDKAKAHEYLEKTRQLDVAICTEHVAALFELNHLKAVY